MALKFDRDFIWTGISDIVFENKKTGIVEINIDTGVDLELTDDLTVNYKQGGLGYKKLIAVTGDRDSKVTFNVATITPDVLKLKSNSTFERKTVEVKKSEELIPASNKVTLKEAPKADSVITVRPIAKDGKMGQPLKVGDPTTNDDEYSITGKEITLNEAVVKVKVYYNVEEERDTMDAIDISSKNYHVYAWLVGKDRQGNTVLGQLDVPNGSVTPSWGFKASNKSDVPDDVQIEIAPMDDAFAGYPIRITLEDAA